MVLALWCALIVGIPAAAVFGWWFARRDRRERHEHDMALVRLLFEMNNNLEITRMVAVHGVEGALTRLKIEQAEEKRKNNNDGLSQ